MQHATGKYFKVLDSDDWLNEEALKRVMDTLTEFENKQQTVEVLFTNYVYEQEGAEAKKLFATAIFSLKIKYLNGVTLVHFQLENTL